MTIEKHSALSVKQVRKAAQKLSIVIFLGNALILLGCVVVAAVSSLGVAKS